MNPSRKPPGVAAVTLRALPALALMVLIFALSSQSDTGSDLPEWARIVGHFTEYALLAALWAWALIPRLGRQGLVAAALICVAYAISDEIHQSLVPGRDADPLDVLVDCAGIATALLVARKPATARDSERVERRS